MKTTNKLKWEAIVSNSASGWAIVNPVTGQGDTKVSIDIKNSDVYASPDTLSGEVTFRCTNCELLDEDEKIKTIQVCRCACDCSLIEIYRIIPETIEESGWKKENPIGSYQVNTRCNPKAVSAVLVNNRNGNTTNLNCADDGYIYLVEDIPYNQDWQNANSFTVYVYFDKGNLPEKTSAMEDWMNPCSHFSFSQAKLECDCSAIKTPLGEVSLSRYFAEQLVIPQSGLADGTQLFTYTIKQYCPHAPQLSAKITFQGGSRNIEISSFNGTTGQGILRDGGLPAYTGGGTRNIKIWIYYNGEECLTATTTQKGCDCDNAINKSSFSAVTCLSVFGVEPGEEIGTYSMNSADNNCPNKISGTLTGGGRTYPLSFANNNKIKLGGSTAIPPNLDSKKEKTFHAEIFYDNSSTSCVDYNMTQKGIDCNCEDVMLSLIYDDENHLIPQTGITASTTSPKKIGEFWFTSEKCKDCENCFKIVVEEVKIDTGEVIEDITSYFEIKTTQGTSPKRGVINLKKTIELNDELYRRRFKITPFYNKASVSDDCKGKTVTPIWLDCDPYYMEQEPKKCTCDNVKLYQEEEPMLPSIGTGEEWIEVATGDIGMYKNPDDPTTLQKSCGSLFGFSDSHSLIAPVPQPYAPERDNRVRTDKIIDPNFPDIDHLYSFKVRVNNNGPDYSDRLAGDVYFQPDEGDPIPCGGINFYVTIDKDACNCILGNPTIKEVECEGSQTTKIELLKFTGVHKDMYVGAEVVENIDGQWVPVHNPETCPITNLEVKRVIDYTLEEPRNYTVSVLGNVSQNTDFTQPLRTAGFIKITTICNAKYDTSGKPIPGTGWKCSDIEPYEIKQKKCPACECDEIKKKLSRQTEEYDYNRFLISYTQPLEQPFEYTSEGYRYIVASNSGIKNCPVIKIEGQEKLEGDTDEWKYIYYEEEGEQKKWFKVRVGKETSYYGETFYLIFYMYTHRDSLDNYGPGPQSIKFIIGYYTHNEETGLDEWHECDDLSFERSIYDTKCNCNLLKDTYFNDGRFDSTYNYFYEYYLDPSSHKFVIKIDDGETEKTEKLFNDNLKGCIELVIKFPDDSTANTYTYNDGTNDLFTITTDGNEVTVTLKPGVKLQQEYHTIFEGTGAIGAIIVPRYMNENGEYEYCDPLDVIIKQDACNCQKLTKTCDTTFTVNISQGQSETTQTILYSYDNNECIKIALVDGANNKYHLGDVYTYTENQVEIFTIKVIGSGTYRQNGYKATGVEVELKQDITHDYIVNGYFYVDGPEDDIICCNFKVKITQSRCVCDDRIGDIHNGEITNTNCETHDEVNVVSNSHSECGYIRLFLLCEEGCTCGEHPDTDGDGTVEESVCIYSANTEYPDEFKYVADMPRWDTGEMSISFLDTFKGNDDGSPRITKFIGFWVDSDGNFIRIDDSGHIVSEGGTYCTKEFTVTEYFNVNCACIKKSDYKLSSNISMLITPATGNEYRINNGVSYDLFTYSIKKSYASLADLNKSIAEYGCLKVVPTSNPDIISFTEELIDDTGEYYTIKVKGIGTITSGESSQTTSLNLYLKHKTDTGNEQYEMIPYNFKVIKINV